MQSLSFFIVAAAGSCVLGYLLLERLFASSDPCTVHISGESVRIVGCAFTPDFIDYAKSLKPFDHGFV
uniref:Movement protein TGBp3 n=1 Tax=Helleborus net necrosis virus TaxID=592206 RepID=B9UZ32_9VIRU|nr:triple gene block protein 3 [Helleborus net necrosis virus]